MEPLGEDCFGSLVDAEESWVRGSFFYGGRLYSLILTIARCSFSCGSAGGGRSLLEIQGGAVWRLKFSVFVA